MDLLTEELSGARGQKEQSSAAEEEELLSRLMAERDQLKTELHHNVQMVSHCVQHHQPFFLKVGIIVVLFTLISGVLTFSY